MDTHTVVSVVATLENDVSILESFLRGLAHVLTMNFRFFEIILVDDGSNDGTRTEVERLLNSIQRVRYLRLSRRFGRDVAMSAGIESAIGDYVVTMDPSSDPVEVIPGMVQCCREEGGIVHGVAENPPHRTAVRELAGNMFRCYCKKHLGVELKRGAEDFRVMNRQAVNALLQVREQSRYLRVLTLTLGYQHKSFVYKRIECGKPERRGYWVQEAARAVDLLTANSRHPLRLVTLVGMAGALLDLLYGGYVLAVFLGKKLILHESPAAGWTTLSLQQSGMFFFVCVILTVMSEYIGIILGEVRSRPLYFIGHEANSSVLLEETVQSSIVKEFNDEVAQ